MVKTLIVWETGCEANSYRWGLRQRPTAGREPRHVSLGPGAEITVQAHVMALGQQGLSDREMLGHREKGWFI